MLKLLSYNIRHGGVGRETYLAEVIREAAPDIVVLQEAIRPQVVERLAAETGMKTWGARPEHSLGFMSRVEIAHHDWYRPPRTKHSFIEIAPAGSEFRIFGLHLRAIHSNWTERRRVQEIGALLKGIEQHHGGFHVLVGDFNTLAPGEALDARLLPGRLRALVWLSGGNIRWETIQILLGAGYMDGYRLLYPVETGFTFPTWSPHLRLDYLFVPAEFANRLKDCQVFDGNGSGAKASDHFPLLAQLEIS